MTEKDLLEAFSSWDNMELMLITAIEKPEIFTALMDVAVYSKKPHSWRAAYVMDKLYDKEPDRIRPYIPKIIEQLRVEQHHGKKRHFLKLISQDNIPSDYMGFLMDYCLDAFVSEKEPVANRVHAMQIMYNISESEPELKTELLEIIQQEIEHHPTPGIRSRGKKLVKQLQKQVYGR